MNGINNTINTVVLSVSCTVLSIRYCTTSYEYYYYCCVAPCTFAKAWTDSNVSLNWVFQPKCMTASYMKRRTRGAIIDFMAYR